MKEIRRIIAVMNGEEIDVLLCYNKDKPETFIVRMLSEDFDIDCELKLEMLGGMEDFIAFFHTTVIGKEDCK